MGEIVGKLINDKLNDQTINYLTLYPARIESTNMHAHMVIYIEKIYYVIGASN